MSNINLYGIDFNKYIVIKQDDLKYITEQDKINLCSIIKTIRDGRIEGNKNTGNKYFVINVDESYANDVVVILRNNNHWK